MKSLAQGLLLPLLFAACSVLAANDSEQGGGPEEQANTNNAVKNVILIIGDGMDDHQLTIARNYLVGARGRLSIDDLPFRGVAQVLTVSEEDPSRAVYVADSANSASAMATGHVTSRGRIATSAGSDKDLPSLVELAKSAGLKAGIVSSASLTDATPAAFYAHVNQRSCENPSMMKDALLYDRVPVDCSRDLKANGGLGSIAEQLLASGLDVALGGGSGHFQFAAEGSEQALLDVARREGFEVLGSIDDLAGLNDGGTLAERRLLGLFAEGTMPVRLRGEGDRGAEAPEPSLMNYVHWSQGEVTLPEPMTCEAEPAFAAVPSLKTMTELALAHLGRDPETGFFLMVESASIDKQSHARKACGSIGEVAQLNEALDSALKFAAAHPQTLIIVTADHGQAAQLVPDQSLFDAFDVPVFTPGKLVRIRTPENAIMAVNYATNDFKMEEHTGVNVPVFTNAEGLGLVPAMVSQAEIFTLIKNYLAIPSFDLKSNVSATSH